MTMDMEFQVGQSVTFGFDVGGGSDVPPEPKESCIAAGEWMIQWELQAGISGTWEEIE